jgi:hypothetical protein
MAERRGGVLFHLGSQNCVCLFELLDLWVFVGWVGEGGTV